MTWLGLKKLLKVFIMGAASLFVGVCLGRGVIETAFSIWSLVTVAAPVEVQATPVKGVSSCAEAIQEQIDNWFLRNTTVESIILYRDGVVEINYVTSGSWYDYETL
jgi:hypothetical protein